MYDTPSRCCSPLCRPSALRNNHFFIIIVIIVAVKSLSLTFFVILTLFFYFTRTRLTRIGSRECLLVSLPWIPSRLPYLGKCFFANISTQVIIKCGGMKNQNSQPTKLDNLWQCRGDLQESRKDEQSKRQAPFQGPHPPHRPPDPHPPWTHDLSSFTFHSISPSQVAHIPQTSSRFRDHPP